MSHQPKAVCWQPKRFIVVSGVSRRPRLLRNPVRIKLTSAPVSMRTCAIFWIPSGKRTGIFIAKRDRLTRT